MPLSFPCCPSRPLQLLGQGDGAAWGSPGKLPAPGQYCYESLQMARYEQGQHFLAHEASLGPALSAPPCCVPGGLRCWQTRALQPLRPAGWACVARPVAV